MARLTKKAIEKAAEKAAGVKAELDKADGIYYWVGDAAVFFEETCLHTTNLNWPGVTIEWFSKDFADRVKAVEDRTGKSMSELIADMDARSQKNSENL